MFARIMVPVICLFLISGCSEENSEPPVIAPAIYKVTFQATWSNSTHPTDFPSNPHFSGIIGMTHNEDGKIFDEGNLASTGIKNMAEIGSKDPLQAEITNLIAGEAAETLISGGGINPSPGSISTEFTVTPHFPLVTIVSMIAPSPDWFVAVEGVELIQNNNWVETLAVPVTAYDSGTDSGATFTSPNALEDPFIPVSLISVPPLANGGTVASMGMMIFERIN